MNEHSEQPIWENIAAVVFLVIAVAVSIWFVDRAIEVAQQITATIIPVIATVLVAVFKHYADSTREREHATLLAKQERNHAAFLAKQKNYEQLLAKVGDFAAGAEGSENELISAHMASWAFGDDDVLEKTSAYMNDTSLESLVLLLKTIRKSLGQEELPKPFFVDYNPVNLVPEEPDRRRIKGGSAQSDG